jgi:DNA-binding transcriptional LysR family regulator
MGAESRDLRCPKGIAAFPFSGTLRAMNHLRFLRYIDEIARVGSIRQAAENLHVAASAVNRRLLDVEEELGTPLFERLPRGMRPTAAGELFLNYIRGRAAELEHVRSEIEKIQGLERGNVRLLASQALAPVFLPQAIASFRSRHPEVVFQARFGDHMQALEALRAFEIELALVFNITPEADIERLAEFEQKLVATMHRTHPLAEDTKGLRLRDCAAYPLALPNTGTGGRQMLDRFLARSPVKLKPVVESNSFEFLRGYLMHEHAISFQFSIGAISRNGDFVAREIVDPGFPRGQLVLATLRERHLPVISLSFAEHLTVALQQFGVAMSG